MKFAKNTSVSVERSKAEIEKLIRQYGATKMRSEWDAKTARILFEMNHRFIRFEMPLPSPEEFEKTPSRRKKRSMDAIMSSWEQACRQKWRALALAIKGKMVNIECGITTFEQEFLAHIVIPNGETVGDFMLPIVKDAYDGGKMPQLMLPWSQA